MTEMVEVDGVRVRADQLDAYLARRQAAEEAEVELSSGAQGIPCPTCRSTFTQTLSVDRWGAELLCLAGDGRVYAPRPNPE